MPEPLKLPEYRQIFEAANLFPHLHLRKTPLRIREAIEGYGAKVIPYGKTLEEAQAHAQKIANDNGLICIPAFDDALMIAGHGTIAKEITDEWSDVDAIIVPVGSGGLISGIAIAAKEVLPNIQIIGVQAEGGVWGGTEQQVVISLPDDLPPGLTGTRHEWQMRELFHRRSWWSQRKSEQKGHGASAKQAHEQAYDHLLFRSSPNPGT